MATRAIELDGASWIAEVTGRGMIDGPSAPAAIESIYFRPREQSAEPVRLAYLPAGAFMRLHDDELATVLRSAPPLADRPALGDGSDTGPLPDGTTGAEGTVIAYPGSDP